MRLRHIALALVALFSLTVSAAPIDSLYRALDAALARRPEFMQRKEGRIDSLRRLLHTAPSDSVRLRLAGDLYRETYTYCFDSAMHYVRLEQALATRMKHPRGIALGRIHQSVLLSTAGYFSESVGNLSTLRLPAGADGELLSAYYYAWEWAYSTWAEYSADTLYAPQYYRREMAYQDSLVRVLPADSQPWHYWQGERAYRHRQYAEAEAHYLRALQGLRQDERLYAMTAYGLALVYARTGQRERYEEYLLRAAISDQVCPLKENLALQELALLIYKEYPRHLGKANDYLQVSMQDARFYGNRLRLLEVANKFPDIAQSYQAWGEREHRRMMAALAVVTLLALGLTLSLGFLVRQLRSNRRQRVALAEMNAGLQQLNEALSATNLTRERYVALFLDLCAAYINKLNNYQNLVKRKVMAKQTDDLLRMVNANRLSEVDAKEFFVNFDTAFLNLYPDFIRSFNALLREDAQIQLGRGDILTTELRIYALIRIGVRDSAKIATLLFYSPQTIYNYRSAVKSRAKDKETFEHDVMELCMVY
jgi:cell division protein FtsB